MIPMLVVNAAESGRVQGSPSPEEVLHDPSAQLLGVALASALVTASLTVVIFCAVARARCPRWVGAQSRLRLVAAAVHPTAGDTSETGTPGRADAACMTGASVDEEGKQRGSEAWPVVPIVEAEGATHPEPRGIVPAANPTAKHTWAERSQPSKSGLEFDAVGRESDADSTDRALGAASEATSPRRAPPRPAAAAPPVSRQNAETGAGAGAAADSDSVSWHGDTEPLTGPSSSERDIAAAFRPAIPIAVSAARAEDGGEEGNGPREAGSSAGAATRNGSGSEGSGGGGSEGAGGHESALTPVRPESAPRSRPRAPSGTPGPTPPGSFHTTPAATLGPLSQCAGGPTPAGRPPSATNNAATAWLSEFSSGSVIRPPRIAPAAAGGEAGEGPQSGGQEVCGAAGKTVQLATPAAVQVTRPFQRGQSPQ